VARVGTGVTSCVVVLVAPGNAWTALNVVRLCATTASKFVPVIVTVAPTSASAGLKPVIVGASVPTTKSSALCALPAGAVTLMTPVVAPPGTVTTSRVGEALVIVAAVPLNETVFCPAVALNPVPETVTVVPIPPAVGVNAITATVVEACRVIDSRLPVAS
jgi:hypothetical protein